MSVTPSRMTTLPSTYIISKLNVPPAVSLTGIRSPSRRPALGRKWINDREHNPRLKSDNSVNNDGINPRDLDNWNIQK